jgi:methylated-DNA-[protein]-cysteine S-methyltransferase
VARELQQYLAGERREFTFPIRSTGSEFSQRVWCAVQEIPYGETMTYGELARRIGKPNALRAVGTANGRNPLPLVIPCHRVVAAGGKLGGYGGGLRLKRKLLDLEAANNPAVR